MNSLSPPAVLLVVNGNEQSRAAVSRYLASEGWGVLEADNGEKGIALAHRDPAVVIVGSSLSDMETEEFCRRMKGNPHNRSLILSCVAAGSGKGKTSDFDGVLSEPVEPIELISTVKLLIRLRTAAGRAEQAEKALRTAQIQLETQRAECDAKVAERTSYLREAISQMEEFSYTVSHDLRAPLRSIKGYAEVLLNDHSHRLKGDGPQFLERIIENGNRMERLVNDVLTISRISSTPLKLSPIEVKLIVDAIVREYPNLCSSVARITVESIPAVVGHEALCIQVVANLLGNAVKFVSPSTVPEVRVWGLREGGKVRINFKDNGIGIEPENHQKIFGMFERLDPENKYGGTGIGLAIVRRAVEKMNGRVGLESDGRSGSLFWVELSAAD